MQDFAFYAGIIVGALLLSIIVELAILFVAHVRKKNVRSKPQPIFNKDRLIRMLFVTALFFILSVFGKKN